MMHQSPFAPMSVPKAKKEEIKENPFNKKYAYDFFYVDCGDQYVGTVFGDNVADANEQFKFDYPGCKKLFHQKLSGRYDRL